MENSKEVKMCAYVSGICDICPAYPSIHIYKNYFVECHKVLASEFFKNHKQD